MFNGIITALATPFKNGNIDYLAFEKFINWQITEGVNAIVVAGTTGESATLELDELKDIIKLAVEITSKRIPVIVGTGSNSTIKACKLTQIARENGADAALIVAPYYNKPTQDGIYAHYEYIHSRTDLPIIVYNVPSRVVVNINDEILNKLIGLEKIIGLKDCSENIERAIIFENMLEASGKQNFAHLTGDDSMALAHAVCGGVGCISVSANIIPKILSQMQKEMQKGNFTQARSIHKKMLKLHKAMFCETNPAPVKYALHLMGIMEEEMRLPLVPLKTESKKLIKDVLTSVGIIQ